MKNIYFVLIFVFSFLICAEEVKANNFDSIQSLRIFYIDPQTSTDPKIRSGDMLNAKKLNNPLVNIITIEGPGLIEISRQLAEVITIPPVTPYLRDTLDIRVLFEFTTTKGNKYLLSWAPYWGAEWINVPSTPLSNDEIDKLLQFLPAVFYKKVTDLPQQR